MCFSFISHSSTGPTHFESMAEPRRPVLLQLVSVLGLQQARSHL